MYRIFTVQDKIRVPPGKFSLNLEEAVKASLEERWEGLMDNDVGAVMAVVSVSDIGEGAIYPGDGSIYYPVTFELLAYRPEVHELVKGYVIDVTEFGVFVRMGPVDGMIHVSQIMDDFVSYDPKGAVFVGRETKRTLKEKDSVTARIISVSMEKGYKIGLTTRQPGLGAPDWADKIKKASNVKGGRKAPPARKGPRK